MRNFKYIKKFRRFGGEPFLDSTNFVGLSKNGILWAVGRDGKRSQLKDYNVYWAEKNWEVFS